MTAEVDELDLELGRLVRLHRLARGISQNELGEAAGISYQQVQKYETGQNRLSIGRLFRIADALGMAPVALMAQLQKRVGVGKSRTRDTTPLNMDFLASKKGQQIIRALASCEDPKLLDAFADLLLAASLPNGSSTERQEKPVQVGR